MGFVGGDEESNEDREYLMYKVKKFSYFIRGICDLEYV